MPNSVRGRADRSASPVIPDTNCSAKSARIDQDRNHGLKRANKRQCQEFAVSEDREWAYAGSTEREKDDLRDGDASHQQGFKCIVDSRVGDFHLVGQRDHRCNQEEDFDPGEAVCAPADHDCSWVCDEECANDVEQKHQQEAGKE